MGYIEHKPAHGVRKPADKRRSFRLAPEEYRALGQALEAAEARGEHWQAIAAIRLIALTGCRRSEILNLKWSEVDFEDSCLRLGDTKTGASLRPLPEPAQAILAHLKRDGDYVFPGVSRATDPMLQCSPRRGGELSALTTPARPSPCVRQRGARIGLGRIDHQGAARSRAPRRDERLYHARGQLCCWLPPKKLPATSTRAMTELGKVLHFSHRPRPSVGELA